MKVSCYLVVKPYGVRMTKNKPNLVGNEVPVFVTLDVPDALFRTPQLRAVVTIPPNSVTSSTITAEVQDNVAKAIKAATGMEVRLSVEAPRE